MAKEKSRAEHVMGGKSKKSGKKSGKHPHEIRIRHGKSGGHIVTHHFQPDESGMTPEPEENVLPDKAALLQHISDNVPDQAAPQVEPAAPPATAPAPAPAAAAAAPPPGM